MNNKFIAGWLDNKYVHGSLVKRNVSSAITFPKKIYLHVLLLSKAKHFFFSRMTKNFMQ